MNDRKLSPNDLFTQCTWCKTDLIAQCTAVIWRTTCRKNLEALEPSPVLGLSMFLFCLWSEPIEKWSSADPRNKTFDLPFENMHFCMLAFSTDWERIKGLAWKSYYLPTFYWIPHRAINYHQKKKSNYHHLHQPIFFLSRGARRSGAIAQLLGVTCLLPSLSLSPKSATIPSTYLFYLFYTLCSSSDPKFATFITQSKTSLVFSSCKF